MLCYVVWFNFGFETSTLVALVAVFAVGVVPLTYSCINSICKCILVGFFSIFLQKTAGKILKCLFLDWFVWKGPKCSSSGCSNAGYRFAMRLPHVKPLKQQLVRTKTSWRTLHWGRGVPILELHRGNCARAHFPFIRSCFFCGLSPPLSPNARTR